jgi:hypothetical protein
MGLKGFVVALLLAAISARAQLEIRPTVALPSAPGIVALAPAAGLMPAAASMAAPLAALGAPTLLPPAAPALAAAPASIIAAVPAAAAATSPAPAPASDLPPAQAHAAALTGALADFAHLDLSAASAGEIQGAGETLMRRALRAPGAAAEGSTPVLADFSGAPTSALAPASAARPAGPRTYLLSRPLRETVKLGPVGLAGHVVLEAGWEFFKGWLAWKATHSPAAVAVLMMVELPFSPAMITVRSLVDLGQRYWRRKLAVLREIARTPGIDRARVLTTGEVRFMGPLARSKDNMGLIFVESSSELPSEVGRFGAPIPIEDIEAQHVRLTLVAPGASAASSWMPSLSHLLQGRPIPERIAAQWRAALSPGKAPIKILLDAAKSSALRIDAALVASDGSEKPLGSIAEGPAVKKLVGFGHLDRLRAWAGLGRSRRNLPVSDTRVERPGDARPAGWIAALRRAWQRLTGRLIVADRRSVPRPKSAD